MSLKRLIQNQKIIIDPHKAGSEGDFKDLHIDKRFIGGKRKGQRIKINITTGKIDYSKNIGKIERKRIMHEIRKALENRQKLKEFSDAIGDTYKRWSSGKITVEEARKYAQRIAASLDLKPKIETEFIKRIEDMIMQYVSIHKDTSGHEYWIQQEKRIIAAGPGHVRFYKGVKQYKI